MAEEVVSHFMPGQQGKLVACQYHGRGEGKFDVSAGSRGIDPFAGFDRKGRQTRAAGSVEPLRNTLRPTFTSDSCGDVEVRGRQRNPRGKSQNGGCVDLPSPVVVGKEPMRGAPRRRNSAVYLGISACQAQMAHGFAAAGDEHFWRLLDTERRPSRATANNAAGENCPSVGPSGDWCGRNQCLPRANTTFTMMLGCPPRENACRAGGVHFLQLLKTEPAAGMGRMTSPASIRNRMIAFSPSWLSRTNARRRSSSSSSRTTQPSSTRRAIHRSAVVGGTCEAMQALVIEIRLPRDFAMNRSSNMSQAGSPSNADGKWRIRSCRAR